MDHVGRGGDLRIRPSLLRRDGHLLLLRFLYFDFSVFLGMHLLFNDPSTSPRTELGRIVYGALYGLSTCVLYQLLGKRGNCRPSTTNFLQVPLLNLSVKWIDRICRPVLHRFVRSLTTRQRNLAYMSIWAVIFAGMSVTQGVVTAIPVSVAHFGRQACEDGRRYACPYLAD